MVMVAAPVFIDSILPIRSTEKYLIIFCITVQLTHGITMLVHSMVGVHVDQESVTQYRVLPIHAPLSVMVNVIV